MTQTGTGSLSSSMLAMFPGQGSQFVGMGRDLLDNFPAAKTTFEEAEDASRLSIRKLCLEGPEDELKLTANTQPCILTMSVAVWRVVVAETGLTPALFAGHSLGEYSALVAAGKMSLARAAWLVRRRGEAMQAAVPAGVGAMAAVMLLGDTTAATIESHCKKVSTAKSVVEVVNYNSPQQVVVAGHKTAVDTLCALLETEKIRFVMLPVSAPFHSSLMAPARDAMKAPLEETQIADTATSVIANYTGRIEPHYSTELLIKQINGPVLWTQSLQAASNAGCSVFFEFGPGKVLFGLARRSLPKDAKLFHSEDIKKAISDVQALQKS
jgi:[acyl-carrier-protein] S-malonyltransferase